MSVEGTGEGLQGRALLLPGFREPAQQAPAELSASPASGSGSAGRFPTCRPHCQAGSFPSTQLPSVCILSGPQPLGRHCFSGDRLLRHKQLLWSEVLPSGHRSEQQLVASSLPRRFPQVVLQWSSSSETPPCKQLSLGSQRGDFQQIPEGRFPESYTIMAPQ